MVFRNGLGRPRVRVWRGGGSPQHWAWKGDYEFRPENVEELVLKLQQSQPPNHANPQSVQQKAAFLGVELKNVDESLLYQLGRVEQGGVLLGLVLKDSPAETAELKKHDLLVRLNGEPVAKPEDVVKAIQAIKPGEEVKVVLLRQGVEQDFTVVLGEREIPEQDILKRFIQPLFLQPPPTVIRNSHPQLESIENVVILQNNDQETLSIGGEPGVVSISTSVTGGSDHSVVEVHSTAKSPVSTSSSKSHTQVDRTIAIQSEEGWLTVREQGGERNLEAWDASEQLVFKGPISTKEQMDQLPPGLRRRVETVLEQLSKELPNQPNPVIQSKELQLWRPSVKPRVIHFNPTLPTRSEEATEHFVL